ncbi:MAG TPA: hypothetical protein VN132_07420, partial [Bdellovibrio sp.]|nr:hypothetical protein [Bdellovibrio sp.]
MRHWIFIILLTLSSAAAEAQKIRVRKVKGNQAVVETTGAPLRQGATYDLISQEDFGDEATANNRHYLIGLNFAMSSLKSDAAGSNNVTAIDFSTRFGWNFGNFEIGP